MSRPLPNLSRAVLDLAEMRSPMDPHGVVALRADDLREYAATLVDHPVDPFWVSWMVREIIGHHTFSALQYDVISMCSGSGGVRGRLFLLFFGTQPRHELAKQECTPLWTVPAFLCLFAEPMFPNDGKKTMRRLRLNKISIALRGGTQGSTASLMDALQTEFERPVAVIGSEAMNVMGTLIFSSISFAFVGVPIRQLVAPDTRVFSITNPAWKMTAPGEMSPLARAYEASCRS